MSAISRVVISVLIVLSERGSGRYLVGLAQDGWFDASAGTCGIRASTGI
jgi:hypothetical protein